MENSQVVLFPVSLSDLTDLIRKVVSESIPATVENKNPKKLITEKELCEFLDLSAPTLIRWRNKRKIPFIRIGNSIRYNVDAVLQALTIKEK